jgi:hypothetical protein
MVAGVEGGRLGQLGITGTAWRRHGLPAVRWLTRRALSATSADCKATISNAGS